MVFISGHDDLEYAGDYILIDRLAEFYPVKEWSWNKNEIITLNDISLAIHNNQEEETQPFGDEYEYMCIEEKSTEYHIGRIIYFINHPEEIKDIIIDNLCMDYYIFPSPIIVDGNHRFVASLYLNEKGKMNKIHCRYGGRVDLLDYLTGDSNECPEE